MSGGHEDGCLAAVDANLAHASRIRELNDQARMTMNFRFVYVTVGIRALGEPVATAALLAVRNYEAFDPGNDPHHEPVATAALLAVRNYEAFDPGNDPHHEHDFGAFDIAGERAFWKIDYYDRRLEFGSPDPANPAVTARVLTIMLAEEY